MPDADAVISSDRLELPLLTLDQLNRVAEDGPELVYELEV